MKLIFISDLHLSPATPKHNQLFFELLSKWQGQIDGLYILGDFFDYWLGDDDDNYFISAIRTQLKQFSLHTPIYFRGGNHDFAVGKKFAKQCGMQLIPDMHTLKVAGNTILLSHGDTFCTLDVGYQKMKRILQNPLVMFILRKIPLKLRYKLKESLENKSHATTNSKPDYHYMVVNESVINYATQANANIIIHGHTHRPGNYSLSCKNATLIQRHEIPDWQDRPPGGYIQLNDDQINIIEHDNITRNN
jgi:UDP-2,3-diacylglucosamine hydrolase